MSSLPTLLRWSHAKPSDVEAVLPPKPLTDDEKAVRELQLLIRQCKETPLKLYRDRFACGRMELCTELNDAHLVEITRYQAELEDELNSLLKSI